jgi:hypothetical protein
MLALQDALTDPHGVGVVVGAHACSPAFRLGDFIYVLTGDRTLA